MIDQGPAKKLYDTNYMKNGPDQKEQAEKIRITDRKRPDHRFIRTSPDFASVRATVWGLTRLVIVGPTPSFAKFFDE